MNVEVRPYFAVGERYPSLIGVRADGDEYEMAYVSKRELADALDENAKLRELVCNLYACARRTRCDGCPYAGEPCDFEYDLRELGIEREL
jgi:hypothetical protein